MVLLERYCYIPPHASLFLLARAPVVGEALAHMPCTNTNNGELKHITSNFYL